MKLRHLAAGLLVAPVSTVALGSTFVDVPDGRLADRATVIVEAVVLSRAAAPVVDRPATDYRMRIERALKGSVPGSVIIVRAPGGQAPGGPELRVWGVPRFKRGERAVLFLEPTDEGVYRFVELALGAFLQVGLDGRRFLVRDLRELRQLSAEGPSADEEGGTWKRVRDRQRFMSWLAARAEGVWRSPDYFVSLGVSETQRLRELMDERGFWTRDHARLMLRGDREVDWHVEEAVASRPSLAKAARAALEQWELAQVDEPTIRLSGTVTPAGGFASYDEANTVILGDSLSRDFRAFRGDCPPDGIVSVSGSWLRSDGASEEEPGDAVVLGGDVQLLLDADCLYDMAAAALPAFGLEPPTLGRRASSAAVALGPAEQEDSENLTAAIEKHSALQAETGSEPQGYQPRACGFDMDDDLVYGEPSDDCNVCDGVTTDVDGDGQNEDLIYVDCTAGADQPGCGTPGSPCRTLDYAINTIADGPSAGQEDIVCFKGSCAEKNITLSVSGKTGHKTRPRSGSEARDFQYPSDPMMVVGWDADNDGEYPPFDTDDTAVLHGGAPGCFNRPFGIAQTVSVDSLELAHFTARQYGTCDPDAYGGFIDLRGLLGATRTHYYLHDLSLDRINEGRRTASGRNIFAFFISTSSLQWAAFENIDIPDTGSYISRGEAIYNAGVESGPLRFKGITANCLSTDQMGPGGGGHCVGYKLWSWVTGIEVLDHIYDLTPEKFNVDKSLFAYFVDANVCSNDWVVRNNRVVDFQKFFLAEPYKTGACRDSHDARSIDSVVVDRNSWINSFNWESRSRFVDIQSCGGPRDLTVENVTFTNNFGYDEFGSVHFIALACVLNGGATLAGEWTFVNNSFYTMGSPSQGMVTQTRMGCATPPCVTQEDIVFKNNVLVSAGNSKKMMKFDFAPEKFQNDYNVYSPGAQFVWGGWGLNWEEWRAETGGDDNGKLCTPAFVDSAKGDLHLAGEDSCAVDSGGPVEGLTRVDIDGEARGSGAGWDVGGDEVQFYVLSVSKSGSGSGLVRSAPSGINCGSDCSEMYSGGTEVGMIAVAEFGWEFGGWSGDVDCWDGSVTMDEDLLCTATFEACTLASEVQLDPTAAPIESAESFEACNVLKGGMGGFRVGSAGEVTFRAGNGIELQNGFSVDGGGRFRAEVGSP